MRDSGSRRLGPGIRRLGWRGDGLGRSPRDGEGARAQNRHLWGLHLMEEIGASPGQARALGSSERLGPSWGFAVLGVRL